jgi:phytoene synthase
MFRDMCVLYAFMRHTDDLGDDHDLDPAERQRRLQDWRGDLDRALNGQADGRILPALADVARRREIPHEYLREVIAGVESDLLPRRFATFVELERYCYQVAGAVGLCCIHVWGFRGEHATNLAIDCGTAFQLTNILRDLGEDARSGRIYLPDDELARFGYGAAELQAGVRDERFEQLMRFEVDRAWQFYARGAELYECLHRPGRSVLTAMLRIYGALLREIERRDFDVFTRPIRLSASRKLAIACTSLLGRRYRLTPAR